MVQLTPQAYVYLRRPRLSSGETMLYHTFQHLCFTGGLQVCWEEVMLGRVRKRPARRLYLKRNTVHNVTTASEAFALDFFAQDEALDLGDLRQSVLKKVKDYERFKYEQVRDDLEKAGLIKWRHWRTTDGSAAYERTWDLIFTVQYDIGRKLKGGRERSLPHVQELGSCMTLLNEDTRDALKANPPQRSDLVAVFSSLAYFEAASSASTSDGIGGFGGGMLGSGGGGGGGFGGFGGGGFGGGGAGRSW